MCLSAALPLASTLPVTYPTLPSLNIHSTSVLLSTHHVSLTFCCTPRNLYNLKMLQEPHPRDFEYHEVTHKSYIPIAIEVFCYSLAGEVLVVVVLGGRLFLASTALRLDATPIHRLPIQATFTLSQIPNSCCTSHPFYRQLLVQWDYFIRGPA
jgi:hypothetical protein